MTYDPDAEFARAKRQRDRQFELRWKHFAEGLRASGAADRKVLGIQDRPALSIHDQGKLGNTAAQWGALAAAFQTAMEDFARSFQAGWNAIRPQDRR